MNLWEVIEKKGRPSVAVVYLLRSRAERDVCVECVESLDPPKPAEEKWVVTLSSQKGCPSNCSFCDASFYYKGNLSRDELKSQFEVILERHRDDGYMLSKKIKLHFARMGEPAFNDGVLEFLAELKHLYGPAAFIPAIATLGPAGRGEWFEKLRVLKNSLFGGGRFQLQFSMNTTDEGYRDRIMPIRKISFEEISALGEKWVSDGDRKVTLNYALFKDAPFEAEKIKSLFDPSRFLVKLTPMNPTASASRRRMESDIDFDSGVSGRVRAEWRKLEDAGFEVILSVGSREEIETGSNCGQLAFANRSRKDERRLGGVIMEAGGADDKKSVDDSRL